MRTIESAGFADVNRPNSRSHTRSRLKLRGHPRVVLPVCASSPRLAGLRQPPRLPERTRTVTPSVEPLELQQSPMIATNLIKSSDGRGFSGALENDPFENSRRQLPVPLDLVGDYGEWTLVQKTVAAAFLRIRQIPNVFGDKVCCPASDSVLPSIHAPYSRGSESAVN